MSETARAPRFPDLPPVWLAVFMLGVLVLERIVPGAIARSGIGDAAGFAVMVAGVLLILWSGSLFGRASTPIHPGRTPKALLATGPYRLNRNPIYTGMALILGGFAMALGVWLGLVLVPLFAWIVTVRFIRAEEALLREAFADEAERYIANTRRW
ncbi:MAG: methyltransferase family protein [Rubricella sp.]